MNGNQQRVLAAPIFATVILLGAAGPVVAQISAGLGAGSGLSNYAAAENERLCRAGVSAQAGKVNAVTEKTDDLMVAFDALKPDADEKALKRVFALGHPDFHWMESSGLVAPEALGAKVGAAQSRILIKGIIAGDTRTVRTLWSISPATEGGDDVMGVDLITYYGSWKILHVKMMKKADAPGGLSAYCHFDRATGF